MKGATRVHGNQVDRQAVVGHHIIERRNATNKANLQQPLQADPVIDPETGQDVTEENYTDIPAFDRKSHRLDSDNIDRRFKFTCRALQRELARHRNDRAAQ